MGMMVLPRTTPVVTPLSRPLARCRRSGRLDDVATRRAQMLVEFELPEVPRERDVRAELPDVRLDSLAASHPRDELGIRPARQRCVHRGREGAAEAGVDVRDPESDFLITEHLDRAR